MRILVIGGTRFIGLYVMKHLHARRHEICVFHRGTTEATLPEGVQQILGNRNQIRENANALYAYQPDVVLDMIPVTERHGID